MTKLLNAGLTSLLKSRIFYIGILIMIAEPLYLALIYHSEMMQGEESSGGIEGTMQMALLMICMISAVLTSALCGTEYSDRTMQNKIVIGHSRAAIYLSELVVNTAACTFLLLIDLVTLFIVWKVIFGAFAMTAGVVIKTLLLEICVIAVYTSIFTMISMLVQTRATSSTLCSLSAMGLYLVGLSIFQQLQQGEDSAFYRFLNDLLPSCQSIRIMQNGISENIGVMVGYDILLIAVTTLGGIAVFRKKDLK